MCMLLYILHVKQFLQSKFSIHDCHVILGTSDSIQVYEFSNLFSMGVVID